MEGSHTITYVHKVKTVERDGKCYRIESRITKEVWTPSRSYSDYNSHRDFGREPEYFFSDDSCSESEDEETVDVMSSQVVPRIRYVTPDIQNLE